MALQPGSPAARCWGGSEVRRLLPGGEHELFQRFPLPRRDLLLVQVLRQAFRVAKVSDRRDRAHLIVRGYRKRCPHLLAIEACHRMSVQSVGGRLQSQIRHGRARVVQVSGDWVFPFAVKVFFATESTNTGALLAQAWLNSTSALKIFW